MKTLTKEEFEDRVLAINRAMKIFGELTNQNITNAFIAYQELLSEQERAIMLKSKQFEQYRESVQREYERPRCPDCGEMMNLRMVPPNKDIDIKTQLVCMNEDCDTVLDSTYDIVWWQNEMKKAKKQTIFKGEKVDMQMNDSLNAGEVASITPKGGIVRHGHAGHGEKSPKAEQK